MQFVMGDAPMLRDFQFEKKLGSGTYATVYKATNKVFLHSQKPNTYFQNMPSGFFKQYNKDEVFAIKCIRRSSLNEISTENLLREIEILKSIKHEYIVQLKDFQVLLSKKNMMVEKLEHLCFIVLI
jgi:serine/threonine protein kinase